MRKFFRIVLLSIFALLVLGTFVYLWQKSQPTQTSFNIESPSVKTITKTTLATGKIEPRNEVTVKPQISGIISEIYVEAGNYVKKGSVIAVIKVIPEMSSLNAAQSRVNLAKYESEQAQLDFDRSKKLYEAKVLSMEEFEKATLTFNKVKEEFRNAEDNLEIVKDGISKNSENLGNTKIKATIEGMVLDVPVKVGSSVIQANNFNDGTTIATIADMSDMIFKGTVDESEVGRIREGMDVDLKLGALQGMIFPAKLEYVSPKGTEQNGAVMFEIKAAANIPDTVLVRAGYSANVEIILDKRTNVLTVPEVCIAINGDSAFVYEQDTLSIDKQVFNKRNVKVGLSDGINIQVLDGVTKNMKLRGAQQFDAIKAQKVQK